MGKVFSAKEARLQMVAYGKSFCTCVFDLDSEQSKSVKMSWNKEESCFVCVGADMSLLMNPGRVWEEAVKETRTPVTPKGLYLGNESDLELPEGKSHLYESKDGVDTLFSAVVFMMGTLVGFQVKVMPDELRGAKMIAKYDLTESDCVDFLSSSFPEMAKGYGNTLLSVYLPGSRRSDDGKVAFLQLPSTEKAYSAYSSLAEAFDWFCYYLKEHYLIKRTH